MSERLSEERIAAFRELYYGQMSGVADEGAAMIWGGEWLADHDALVEELKEADLDNGILLRKAATLAADLGTVTAERDRYAACHEAELGVCFQHCDEVKELTAERDRARDLAVRLEQELSKLRAVAEAAKEVDEDWQDDDTDEDTGTVTYYPPGLPALVNLRSALSALEVPHES